VCGCGVWGVAGAPKNKNCHFCEHAPKRSAFFACLNPSCDQVACYYMQVLPCCLCVREALPRHVLARESDMCLQESEQQESQQQQ
jgi:hypothetical protein